MLIKTPVSSRHVRAFEEDDIPQVAELHRRVFHTAPVTSPELLDRYRRYFSEVFASRPGWGEGFDSLVHCSGDKVTGFLGTVARPMLWNGERVVARISSQFIVDPDSRGLAGLELLRAFFNGPQDISLADESNRDSRRLWEALGGATSLAHSLQWICPLRPCRFTLWALGKRQKRLAHLARSAAPIARGVDAIAAKVKANPFRAVRPEIEGEEISNEALAARLSESGPTRPLYAIYDAQLLQWLLDRANRGPGEGEVKKVLVTSARNEYLGWYVYRLGTEGFSEMLHLFARKGHAQSVLQHAAYHAWQAGAAALRGRCEPMLAEALAETHWPCHWGPWVLFHSQRPGLSAAFQRDVLFSRLDGEWCLRFP